MDIDNKKLFEEIKLYQYTKKSSPFLHKSVYDIASYSLQSFRRSTKKEEYEDLLSDVYLKIIERIFFVELDEKKSVFSYIVYMAKTKAIDIYRKKKKIAKYKHVELTDDVMYRQDLCE